MLLPKGLNIADLIMKNGRGDAKNVSYNMLLCATIQIFFADLLKVLEVRPTAVHGIFSGEFVKAYFDGVLSLEQTVLSLFHLASLVSDGKDGQKPPEVVSSKSKYLPKNDFFSDYPAFQRKNCCFS